MGVARCYFMVAGEGRSDALLKALLGLREAVLRVPGSLGVDLLHDIGNPARFTFIEKWESIAAHELAGTHIDKAALAPVMAALAEKPAGSYLTYL